MPKFDFDGLLDWLEEEINDCEEDEREELPADDYMDPITLAPMTTLDTNDVNDFDFWKRFCGKNQHFSEYAW